MNGFDFFDCVAATDGIELVLIAEAGGTYRTEGGKDYVPEEDCIVVRNREHHCDWVLPVRVVAEQSWTPLREILLGIRQCKVLRQMTRIVGYYSPIDNWNKSKLGELADRRKGVEFYAVPDAA